MLVCVNHCLKAILFLSVEILLVFLHDSSSVENELDLTKHWSGQCVFFALLVPVRCDR